MKNQLNRIIHASFIIANIVPKSKKEKKNTTKHNRTQQQQHRYFVRPTFSVLFQIKTCLLLHVHILFYFFRTHDTVGTVGSACQFVAIRSFRLQKLSPIRVSGPVCSNDVHKCFVWKSCCCANNMRAATRSGISSLVGVGGGIQLIWFYT